MDKNNFDVIIIGGSYAGLSAAMALGRSVRQVLVIDSGLPCNRQTPHSHNFITQDGRTPKEISTLAREQVASYSTVTFVDGIAVSAAKTDAGFSVTAANGNTFSGKKLIIATGIRDMFDGLPGLAECWGISVVHCPYCHGYEIRNVNTGILANGEAAMHYALLVSNLTKTLSIFTNGDALFTEDQEKQLQAKQIDIVSKEIASLDHNAGHLKKINFKDGSDFQLEALYHRAAFTQHSGIPESLACELTDQGFIQVNPFQLTSVPGVFACGDNASPMRSVANAVASGNMAGAAVNAELCKETF
jgi:thioredoxin reductase